VIDFHVLKERNFALSTLTMLVLGFVLYGSTALLPMFLQTLLGYTAMLSGMVLSPGGIVIVFTLPLVGYLLRKLQARWLIVFGVLVSSTGLFIMSRFNLQLDFRTAVESRMAQSLGLAFLFVPISTMAFALVPKARMGYATGLFNLARNIGGSCGIATVTTLLSRRAQHHQQALISHMTPLDAPFRSAIEGATGMLHMRGASLPDAAAQAQRLVYGNMQRQASMLAFADAFWVMGVLFLGIIPLMFMMKSVRPAKAPLVVE
jgi:DHA2 family multidrug resistance protein